MTVQGRSVDSGSKRTTAKDNPADEQAVSDKKQGHIYNNINKKTGASFSPNYTVLYRRKSNEWGKKEKQKNLKNILNRFELHKQGKLNKTKKTRVREEN